MVEQYEHLEDYHAVFAQSLGSIVNFIGQKQEKQAQQLILYNIVYAYTLWRTMEKPEIEPDDVVKELAARGIEADQHLVMMVVFQCRAGLRPVQRYQSRARMYGRVRDRL